MRLVLDACVLFPETVRDALLAYAEAGGFTPLWSDRLLEEWARAAGRTGMGAEISARQAAAAITARFPDACVTEWEALADPQGLPDPADAHVLAAAQAGGAVGVVTFNIRDFPLRIMAARGLARLHPDEFLRIEWVAGGALDQALAGLGYGEDAPRRLKRAGLPRLAKALRNR